MITHHVVESNALYQLCEVIYTTEYLKIISVRNTHIYITPAYRILECTKTATNRCSTAKCRGLPNTAINKLSFEHHLLGYQYCGPGTKVAEISATGDPGINYLDRACKEDDIAYSQSKGTRTRSIADIQLAERAWQRVYEKDLKLGEQLNAWLITNVMKAKAKLGMSLGNRSKNNKRKASSKEA